MFDHHKYKKADVITLTDRQWPNRQLEQAPQWCSVDLRDGNQALINPMSIAQKHHLFDLLVQMGFKEIEVGFPAASQTDFDFVREIIEQEKIPDDVTIQVLTQARDSLIERSFEALKGANKAIMHVYNSTSTIQREQVFQLDQQGIIEIAVHGAKKVMTEAQKYPQTQWQFQYSPESFTQTEMPFAVEVCNAVIEQWQASGQPIIINLPATVEVNTPNVYADQIEYMCRHINNREKIIISLHTHNDRGCGVAAAELGVLAGADRVEGTLLGNGERTGNMDIVTMAMNLYSQGIDPQLDFSDMDRIIKTVNYCTEIELHPRHPYAGDLVFTAFSGSHQDAIKKCLNKRKESADNTPWQVAYLPIDPEDLGRNYEAVIRINSQSGKGGAAYIIEQQLNISMPRWMQVEFSQIVQRQTEQQGQEISANEIVALFDASYRSKVEGLALKAYDTQRNNQQQQLSATLLTTAGEQQSITGEGMGLLEAFCMAMKNLGPDIHIIAYEEISTDSNEQSQALCTVQLSIEGQRICGLAQSSDIAEAGLQAILHAYNRYHLQAG